MNKVNQEIQKHLQKWMDQNTVPHSLLFAGSIHSPCEEVALSFARKLVGQESSPDLYLYRPEGKLGLHTMEAMRELRDEVYMPPYQSKKKVFVIFSADRMLPPSANALLKTFEEPLLTSVIILVSNHPEKLLATVRSRCQSIHFQDENVKLEKYIAHLAPLLANLPSISPIALLDEVAKLASLMEKDSAVEEVSVKDETAYQKQAREKAGEGKEALNQLSETEAFFTVLLGWFRDLHAVHLSLPKSALLLPSEQASLQAWVDTSAIPNLDKVQKLVEKAKAALSRSSPLKNVLESFFLSLRYP
jgi:DNA polymerase-3 subunit delta'